MSNLTLDLSSVINTAIDEKLETFDLDGQIKTLLGDVVDTHSKVISISLNGDEPKRLGGLTHSQFSLLLSVVATGENVLITGGAGLGKTSAIVQVATALQLEFRSMSFSNQTTKSDLFGFVNAQGIFASTGFVDAFIDGHVFLGDEMDACSANVFVLLNSAIENGFITLPDGRVVERHVNFRFIGTANTNLLGASGGFTARNQMDEATIDRFSVIEWTLDLEMEQKITQNDGWLEIVRAVRKVALEDFEKTITPRPSYKGAKLLKAGVDIDAIIDMTLIKAMGKDESIALKNVITKTMKNKAIKDSGAVVAEVVNETVETIIVDDTYSEPTEEGDNPFGEWA